MNRIKTKLVYRTRQEYENMLRRYESELQQGTRYSRHEESRLLEEKNKCRLGIQNLDAYEKIEAICDQLKKSLKIKKQELSVNILNK